MDEVYTPQSDEVDSVQHALSIVEEEYDFPVVIKREHLSGGAGVYICEDKKEVESAFYELRQKESEPSFFYSLWKKWNLIPFMTDVDSPGEISVQQCIDGEPFLHSFVAIDGHTLGGNTVRRELPYDGPTSPHCRYRIAENEKIREAANSIVERVGFGGFGCFDFIVDKEEGIPYLIECNPFPVNVAHLGHVLRKDLCRALRRGLSHSVPASSEYQSEKENAKGVAILFPYELIRNPDSTRILSHPEDVPFDDLSLLRAIQEHFDIPSRSIDQLIDSH